MTFSLLKTFWFRYTIEVQEEIGRFGGNSLEFYGGRMSKGEAYE
jgi:hypothetical protein